MLTRIHKPLQIGILYVIYSASPNFGSAQVNANCNEIHNGCPTNTFSCIPKVDSPNDGKTFTSPATVTVKCSNSYAFDHARIQVLKHNTVPNFHAINGFGCVGDNLGNDLSDFFDLHITSSNNPYQRTLNNLGPGKYYVTTRIWRAGDGVSYFSNPISFTVVNSNSNEADFIFNPGYNSYSSSGSNVTVSMRLENQGNILSQWTRVEFFLSTDSKIETSDYSLGSHYVNTSLCPAPGSCSFYDIQNHSFPVPSIAPPGQYYVGYIINPLQNDPEQDYDNNTYVFPAPLYTKPGVNLFPETYPLISPSVISAGGSLSIICNVHNQGTQAVGNNILRVFYSEFGNTSLGASTQIGQANINSIPAGASHPVMLSGLSIPQSVNTGTRYICFQADAPTNGTGTGPGSIAETEEYDNVVCIPITVCEIPPPNFYYYPSPAEQGETVTFIYSGGSGSGGTLNWAFQNGNPSTATGTGSKHVAFNAPGTKTVSLTTSNGCGSVSSIVSVKVEPDPDQPTPATTAIQNQYPTQKISDPVNAATGAYTWQQEDLTIRALNGIFSWSRFYNSQLNEPSNSMGHNWSHSFDFRIEVSGDFWNVHYGDGHWEYFVGYDDGTTLPMYSGTTDELTKDLSDGTYELTQTNGQVFHFSISGQLDSIVDRNGNAVILQYIGNELDKITFPGGRFLDVVYSGDNISSIKDDGGRTVSYNYISNRLHTVTNTRNSTTTFHYEGSTARIESVTDPNTNTLVHNDYDANGRVRTQTDHNGNTNQFFYDTPSAGKTTVVNPLHDTAIYEHDIEFRLVGVEDESGNFGKTIFDDLNLPEKITDALGRTTNIDFDANGNATDLIAPDNGHHVWTYNNQNLPLTYQDPIGGTTEITYDVNGNPKIIEWPNGDSTKFGFTNNGQIDTITDPENITTHFLHNAAGDIIEASGPGGTTHFFHDVWGRADSIVDRNGNNWRFRFDAFGNVVTAIDPANDSVHFAFDANGNLTSTWDQLGSQTNFTFDEEDHLETITDALGQQTYFERNENGQIVRAIDRADDTLQFSYSPQGLPTEITTALGSFHFTHDSVGNPKTQTDAMGNTTTVEYDVMDRPSAIHLPEGGEVKLYHNLLGLIDSIVDPKGNITSYKYDSMRRLIEVKTADKAITKYERNGVGNVTRIFHPDGDTTVIAYDDFHQPSTVIHPGGYTEQFVRGNEEYLREYTNANGETTDFKYNEKYEIDSIVHHNGHTYTFDRDPNGRVTQMTNDNGTTSLQRDALGRVTQVTDPFGNVLKYGYDGEGRVVFLVYPGNDTVTYQYNGAGLLSKVADWAGNWSTRQYNANGDLEKVINSNGTETVITWDRNRRVKTYRNDLPSSLSFNNHNLTYDLAGNPVNDQGSLPLYPVLPNDTTIEYTYVEDDRIASETGVTYTSNNNGAITQVAKAGTTNTYNWVENDLLIEYFENGVSVTNRFNPWRQRITQIKNGDTTRFTVDIIGAINGLSQVLETRQGNNALKHRYIHTSDGLGWALDAGDVPHFYFFDYLGNTIALTDSNGVPTDTLAYGPFGDWLTHHGNSTIRFGWQGRYGVEYEGGNHYQIRARDYDAGSGRFLSKDRFPADLSAPLTINRFSYGLNQPLIWIDPNGQKESTISLGNFCVTKTNELIPTEIVKYELTDQTERFDDYIKQTEDFFRQKQESMSSRLIQSNILSSIEKIMFFGYHSRENSTIDPKNYDEGGFNRRTIRGKYAKYRNTTFRYDDFGNYNFGYAARVFGISLEGAKFGAGIDQIFKGNPDWSNWRGYFDHRHDTYLIEQGYFHRK